MSVTRPPEGTPLVAIKGDATPEEVAALVAVVSGMAAAAQLAAASAEKPVVSEWAAPHRKVRQQHAHGPGGWRASSLPR